MKWAIDILLAVLLIAGVVVAWKLYTVLGDVHKLLGKVENTLDSTRQEISDTMQRVDSITQTADKLMREEITPTIQYARETMSHVELTTRAISDSTLAARRIVTRVESLTDTSKLLINSAVVAKRSAGVAGGLVSRIQGLFGAKKKSNLPALPEPKKAEKRPNIVNGKPTNEIVIEREVASPVRPVSSDHKRR